MTKKVEWNCGNDIAEIGGKKFYFSWFLAIPLPKLREKKLVGMNLWQWHYRNRMKKKKLLQLVCGNGIAEIEER